MLDLDVRRLRYPDEQIKITASTLRNGFRRAVQTLNHRRFNAVVSDLVSVKLPPLEKARGRAMLRELVSKVFETDCRVAEAVLLQWILNVKRPVTICR